MKINIFNKLKNDVVGAVENALGLNASEIIIFDSIEDKEIKIKPKVLRIESSGPVEISKIPVQFKQSKIGSISDNIVLKGDTYEMTIFETEGLGVLETAGSLVSGGLAFGKNVTDAGMGKSSIRNLIAILDKAKKNGFRLEYNDGFETIKQLYIVNNPRIREAKDRDKQIEIRLSVAELYSFTFEQVETKTTNIKAVNDVTSFAGLQSAINKVKNIF
jgi:hypothetical protein